MNNLLVQFFSLDISYK